MYVDQAAITTSLNPQSKYMKFHQEKKVLPIIKKKCSRCQQIYLETTRKKKRLPNSSFQLEFTERLFSKQGCRIHLPWDSQSYYNKLGWESIQL